MVLFFDPESKQLRDVGSVTKTDKARKFFRKRVDGWVAKQSKTEIEVECGVAQPEIADLTQAMNAVFLAPGEVLARVVPDFMEEIPRAEDAGVTGSLAGCGDGAPCGRRRVSSTRNVRAGTIIYRTGSAGGHSLVAHCRSRWITSEHSGC